MTQKDEDARKVTEVLHLAYWNTFEEAVAAAHLRRVLNEETMAVYQAHTGGFVATPISNVDEQYKVLAIININPAYKHVAKHTNPIGDELAKLRSDLTDLAKRVNDAIASYDIKPEHQPQ